MIGSVIGRGALTPPRVNADGVRVSQAVSRGLLVSKVEPEYPEQARKAGIEGAVVLEVVIDEKGSVENITMISGHPGLVSAAFAAVKNWKYKPYILNGQPTRMETAVTLNFELPK